MSTLTSTLPSTLVETANNELGRTLQQPPLVVWLHGWMGHGIDFRELVTLVPGRHLLLDLPGHGRAFDANCRSVDANNRLVKSFPDWERTLDLIDVLVPAGAVLAGYSMGGRLALALALRNPKKLAGLILESTTAGLADDEVAARLELEEAHRQNLRTEPVTFVRRWFEQPVFSSLRNTPLAKRLEEERCAAIESGVAAGWIEALSSLSVARQPASWSKLPMLNLPTLIGTGVLDPKYCELGARIAGPLPRSRHKTIAAVGHNLHRGAADRWAKVIRQFLGELSQPSPLASNFLAASQSAPFTSPAKGP